MKYLFSKAEFLEKNATSLVVVSRHDIRTNIIYIITQDIEGFIHFFRGVIIGDMPNTLPGTADLVRITKQEAMRFFGERTIRDLQDEASEYLFSQIKNDR